MKAKSKTVDEVISDAMRKVAAALTPEQRKSNARKAWLTRRANLAKKLAA